MTPKSELPTIRSPCCSRTGGPLAELVRPDGILCMLRMNPSFVITWNPNEDHSVNQLGIEEEEEEELFAKLPDVLRKHNRVAPLTIYIYHRQTRVPMQKLFWSQMRSHRTEVEERSKWRDWASSFWFMVRHRGFGILYRRRRRPDKNRNWVITWIAIRSRSSKAIDRGYLVGPTRLPTVKLKITLRSRKSLAFVAYKIPHSNKKFPRMLRWWLHQCQFLLQVDFKWTPSSIQRYEDHKICSSIRKCIAALDNWNVYLDIAWYQPVNWVMTRLSLLLSFWFIHLHRSQFSAINASIHSFFQIS